GEMPRFGQLYLQKGVWRGRQIIRTAWVEEATSRQTSNGSAPTSDWDQGYGYQFWRCRHNAYRGDGAFGQYCIVIPEQDAVVAITSGVRNMQSVMNLVWDKLLPAMKPRPLPEDAAARKGLQSKLAGRAIKMPAAGSVGGAAAPAAARLSGQWYEFAPNDRGIQAVKLDLNSESPALFVRATSGDKRTPIGLGAWAKSRGGFCMGIDQFLSVPAEPLLAASGAWTADNVFTVRIVAYETPFYSTLNFRFDGDRLQLEAEHNVAFGPTRLPVLEGRPAPAR